MPGTQDIEKSNLLKLKGPFILPSDDDGIDDKTSGF
jgi:hypothetical protein